jgi:uncharacterized membrane protein YgcG
VACEVRLHRSDYPIKEEIYMPNRWSPFLVTSLFGFATLAAGCAARDVDVSQRGPIRGEATVEGDRTRSESSTQQKKSSGSGSASGSVSGGGSATGSGSASGTITER